MGRKENRGWLVAALFAVVSVSAIAQLPEDGIISYYPLDASTVSGKDVKDVIGKNPGVINGKISSTAGKVREGMEFDGASPIEIAGTESLNFAKMKAFSVAAWVNAASDDPVVGVVAGCCGSIVAQRNAAGWALRYDGRNAGMEMEFIVNSAGWVGDGGFGVKKLAPKTWHHLVGVYGEKDMIIYLNGEVGVSQASPGGSPVSTGVNTEIGKSTDGGWVGKIDEVLIYNRAITAADVKKIYTASGLGVEPSGKAATKWGEMKSAR